MDESTKALKELLDKSLTRLREEREINHHLKEPIAIIGMSGVFPGAKDLESFWSLLHEGRSGLSDVPSLRWDADAYFDTDREAPGKMVSSRGGFIEDIERFDAGFFNISPREALYLDPQQRLLLMTSWHALEHAGIAPESLRGSHTGVFVGIATQDYTTHLNHSVGIEGLNAYMGTGNALSTATGRLSYSLGLEGPNMALDTACSSSLVALHEACRSLQHGECHLALVGGVNAILSPELSIIFSKAGMLSPESLCKTFDEGADGYVRGEGCGVMVVKRLSDAQRDGDRILAVVRGTGINQDGASSGLTVPNGEAQEHLLQEVLQASGLSVDEIDYLECHGTATSLGDPVEVHAIGRVYEGRSKDRPLKLGSVKTNIGHLEAAAGIAGLMKTILALEHHELPAHLNFKQLNHHINLNFPAEIVTANQPWDASDKARCAGVSSFGFSGTNAHIILEEAPAPTITELETGDWVLCLSAKTPAALEQMIEDYILHLESNSDERIQDIVYTANTGRAKLECKGYFKAISREQLLDNLINTHATDEPECTPTKGNKLTLPSYPFERQSYWLDIKAIKTLPYGPLVHELLGVRLSGHSQDMHFLNQLSLQSTEYLKDHILYGRAIVPGAAFVESALASGIQALGETPIKVGALSLLNPLSLEPAADYEVTLAPKENNTYSGTIYAKHLGALSWIEHAEFQIEPLFNPTHEVRDLEEIKASLTQENVSMLYERLSQMGLVYGKAFQSIQEAFIGPHQALVKINNEDLKTAGYCLHPALLDGVFQSVALAMGDASGATYIPSTIAGIEWYQRAQGLLWADVTLISQDAQALKADITITDKEGLLIAQITGFVARAVTRQALEQMLSTKGGLESYIEDYEVYSLPEATEPRASASETLSEDEAQHVMFFYEGDFNALVIAAKDMLINKPKSFTLVTERAFVINDEEVIQPEHRQALGFWKSLRLEAGNTACYIIDRSHEEDMTPILDLIKENALAEPQIILRDQIYVPRLLNQETYAKRHHRLVAPTKEVYFASNLGIDTLHWAKRPTNTLAEDELKIRIEATALNFRDVLKAMDLYPGEAGDFGYECVGEVIELSAGVEGLKLGDKVIAIGEGLFGGEVSVKRIQVALLPHKLSPAQGASLPVVFLTAHHALYQLAQMKKGQSVLIHAATGGVGLAALELARLRGLNVYATTSKSKQETLRTEQGLKYIYDSRSTLFAEQLLKDTKGKGVDAVLNSLTGEGFIPASLACLTQGGTFLEIGKINIYTLEQMEAVRPDVRYHIIGLDRRMQEEPEAIQKELEGLLALFEEGQLNPLPITEFPITQAIDAFHYLQGAKQIGKVVLCNHKPFAYKSEGTYLITGGTGGLGHELARHLIDHGARHLALTSRRKASESLRLWIEEQKEHSITITHYQTDVADKVKLKGVFEAIAQSGQPLKGVFHAAGVLHDKLIADLTPEEFDAVLAPKVMGSINLHELSRRLNLDCFILFSSIASLLGNLGQSNYAAANAFMDGLAIKRRHEGLPGLSINWGPFAAVGMATSLASLHQAQGMTPLKPQQAFLAMDAQLASQPTAELGIMDMDWSKMAFESNPYLMYLITNKSKFGGFIALLKATVKDKQAPLLERKIKQILANILNIVDPDSINSDKEFIDLGMDSLMAMEFRNRIQEELGNNIKLPLNIIFESPNTNKLAQYLFFKIDFNTPIKSNKALNISEYQGVSITKYFSQPVCLASEGQRRLFYLTTMTKDKSLYNLGWVIKSDTVIDPELFFKACDWINRSNPILRTYFQEIENHLYQVVDDKNHISVENLCITLPFLIDDQLQNIIHHTIYSPFNLNKGPLYRYQLVTSNEDQFSYMIFSVHHCIFDGYSQSLFMTEFNRVISLLEQGIALDAEEYSKDVSEYSYHDYTLSLLNFFQSKEHDLVQKYWVERLRDASPLTELPGNKGFLSALPKNNKMAYFEINLDNNLTKFLQQYCIEKHTTLFYLVYSVFFIMVNRYTQTDDLVIGCVSSSRELPELKNVMGYTVQTLPTRITIDPQLDFDSFLEQFKKTVSLDLTHQFFDFGTLFTALNNQAKGLLSGGLFKILFGFESYKTQENILEKAPLDYVFIETASTHYNLNVGWIFQNQKNLKLAIKYNENMYREDYVKQFFQQYITLLQEVTKEPGIAIKNLNLLNDLEKEKLLGLNSSQRYPDDVTLHGLVELRAVKTPLAEAIVFNGQKITYQELNKKANQLAHYLISLGVKPGDIVACCLDRSIELIISILGILKAGGAYLPADPESPAHRTQYMLDEAKNFAVITTYELQERLLFKAPKVLIWEKLVNDIRGHKDINPALYISPNSLAYIIFTSGSTGEPKGVMVSHFNITQYVLSNIDLLLINSHDCVSQYYSSAFDTFGAELWPTIAAGAKLIIIPQEARLNIDKLKSIIREQGITIIDLPVTLFSSLLREQLNSLPSLRIIKTGGDKLLDVPNVPERIKLYNMYGPTEATIESTYCLLDSEILGFYRSGMSVVGRPYDNEKIYIVDHFGNLAPKWVPGEICITGPCVAIGYLNDPILTSEKFVENPFNPGTLMYRTGDIGRWLDGGNLEFLGRIDDQVKIRGFRVEIGEIEAVLMSHNYIDGCAVIIHHNELGDKQLIAYLVTKSEQPTIEQLRIYLKNYLPYYMIPSLFIWLEEMPLTISGKVNRKALPYPIFKTNELYIKPRTDIEKRIEQIWIDVLEAPQPSIRDDFFELGGHSLLLTDLTQRINAIGLRKISALDLYSYSTIELQAQFLSDSAIMDENNASTIHKIKLEGNDLAPLFLVHPIQGVTFQYNTLETVKYRSVYGISYSYLSKDGWFDTVEAMASYYIEQMISIQKNGPYLLGGWSFGGNIALEMAYQLEQKGELVEGVILFDSWCFDSICNRTYEETKLTIYDDESIANIALKLNMTLNDEFLQALKKSYHQGNFLIPKLKNRPLKSKVILIKATLRESYPIDLEPMLKDFAEYIIKSPCNGFDTYKDNMSIFKISANHTELFTSPHIDELKRILNKILSVL